MTKLSGIFLILMLGMTPCLVSAQARTDSTPVRKPVTKAATTPTTKSAAKPTIKSAAKPAAQRVPRPVQVVPSADLVWTPPPKPATAKPLQTPRPRRRFWLEGAVGNVYDSNIQHDSTNIGSYGVVAGANGRFRTHSSRPGLQLEYGIAAHSYTATDRWDRISQIGRATVDMPLGRVLLAALTGEVFLKGSSEDREIGDQYAILPRIELRPVRNVRLRGIAAYRKRYYGEASGSNATNRYVHFDSRLEFGDYTFDALARLEKNLPKTTRFRFERQTYTGRLSREFDRDEILVGLEYRPVKYPERTVDIPIIDEDGEEDEIEVPRRDTRWKPHLRWTREWARQFRTEFEYEYEMRGSNDPDKRYRGHVITLTSAVLW